MSEQIVTIKNLELQIRALLRGNQAVLAQLEMLGDVSDPREQAIRLRAYSVRDNLQDAQASAYALLGLLQLHAAEQDAMRCVVPGCKVVNKDEGQKCTEHALAEAEAREGVVA